jgi:hypothetical protein
MQRFLIVLSIVFAGFASAVMPNAAHAQWQLYDSFSHPLINPERWSGFEASGGLAAPNTETARHVILGVLHQKLVGYGSAASDSGSASHTTGLQVTDPASVIGIQAKVAVIAAIAKGCAGNTTTARARAQLIGEFFNNGSGGPSDRTGDILAGIQKQLDSLAGRQILAFINRCNDAGCTSFTSLATHLFGTTWNFGQSHVLRVEWDAVSNEFIFTINPGSSSEESHVLSYGESDSAPPVLDFKRLSLNSTTPNCERDQLKTSIHAAFHNVHVLPVE